VHNIVVWGNHSLTQYPDTRNGYVQANGKDTPINDFVKDQKWIENEFV